jgi:inorganic pyrophosphatase
MDLSKVGPGSKLPEQMNVIIEIPANAAPVKYELEKETGAMFVDRFMSTAMYYPCNYGYIPQTLSEDGDPCDVLVITPTPLLTGVVIACRPVAMLRMTDEKGKDEKILAVPVSKLTPIYDPIQSVEDVSPYLLKTIEHFFEHYKDLEANKWVKVDGWVSHIEAYQEIMQAVERFGK